MSRRHLRRRSAKAQRHNPPPAAAAAAPQPIASAQPPPIIRHPARVERLAYTRTQAAEALGISRSTLTRVLPYVETIELPWGTTLIPVDELERLLAERRRAARERPQPSVAGRPQAVAADVVDRIRAERAAGKTLRQIADALNASGTPTGHGGRRWWASTVRSVLLRVA